MNLIGVIPGTDLKKYKFDLAPEFVEQIDPAGYNLINATFLHNDDSEVRAMMMFKLLGREEPFDGTVTIPLRLFNKIRLFMEVED
jgi:hypothetical protein